MSGTFIIIAVFATREDRELLDLDLCVRKITVLHSWQFDEMMNKLQGEDARWIWYFDQSGKPFETQREARDFLYHEAILPSLAAMGFDPANSDERIKWRGHWR